ncbi:SDR family oxidoreductase [Microbacterium elymi]|uniref:SDR family oxidoreductase n=1 Tax=Microbacterium elymi TaxID=2909587 RepID=A0ABY5NII3_9MICO|nr:SDR family oxidoreductase [Microbacterium elymi]UUT34993.1 SDR family oxidoreductase [Microbacterium elymi]
MAIAGGTGTVGRLVAEHARRRGHEPIVLSRSTGIDLMTGEGLDAVLAGVDAVIDVSGSQTLTAAASVRYFQTTTRMLLEAEQRAGVGHHLALSIVGIDRTERGYGYYEGKLAQERAVTDGPVPWTLLRATQFHEFAQQMFDRMKMGPFVLVPTMRSQPVAADEVAARLVELAEGAPAGRVPDLAGPRVERMADLARRYGRAAGVPGRVVELSLPGRPGHQMRDGSLLAGTDAQVVGATFTEWLRERTGSDGESKAARTVGVAGIPIVRAPLPSPPEPSLSNARELIAGLADSGHAHHARDHRRGAAPGPAHRRGRLPGAAGRGFACAHPHAGGGCRGRRPLSLTRRRGRGGARPGAADAAGRSGDQPEPVAHRGASPGRSHLVRPHRRRRIPDVGDHPHPRLTVREPVRA